MMTNLSHVRRAYDAVALFALLNLIALGMLVTYLVAAGGMNAEKVRRIVGVLRGEDIPQAEAVAGQPAEADTDQRESETSRDVAAESQMDQEILRREGERIKAELDQRLALNNSILLRVIEKRESFKQEQEEAAKQRASLREQRHDEGFKKQIAIYESLVPKTAVEHLLAMSDPDEAARVLLKIQTRKAKKIVEAAKRGDQLKKMKAILQRVREVAPDRSAELEPSEP